VRVFPMMPTKLSFLCDRIIEAGWLVALVVTPLFFNVHSSRIFEPDKITLLRSLALLMVLAWMVKGLESWRVSPESRKRERLSEKSAGHSSSSLRQRGERGARGDFPEGEVANPPYPPFTKGGNKTSWRSLATNPLLLLALLFLADSAFATATSIAPRLSLWGSYERLQGLYTTSAYLVIFFSIVALLRTEEQLERLLTTALVVSFPISLYGIIQHFGIDPVLWGEDSSQRVISTFGNPIFAAAFLIMVVPLTLYRLLEAGRAAMRHESSGTHPILHNSLFPLLRFAIYSVLLSAQLRCIFLTQSRGPWLGLLSGLLLFAVLWTLVHRRWRWAMFITGSGFIIALLFAVIALPHSPLTFVREVPYLGRFARVVEGTGQVRILIWQGAVQLITANPVHTVIGYGPETMLVASYPHYSPALSQVEHRTAFPDRSHNETFDVLVTTGLVGFTIHFLLFTSLFYYGLKGTGLIHSSAERRVFLGLWLAGGIGTTGLVCLLDHSWRFCGVALPLGMLGGLFVYLGWYGFSRFRAGKQQAESYSTPSLILVPLLSALAAHFSEITFGIAIASTRTYFWAYAALLVVAVHTRVPSPIAGEACPERPSTSALRAYAQDDRKRRAQHERFFSARPERSGVKSKDERNANLMPLPLVGEGQERRDPRPMATGRKPELGLMERPSLWSRSLLVNSLLASLILATLVYTFLSPEINRTHILSIVWLLAATWVFAGLVILTERDVNPPALRAAPLLQRGVRQTLKICGVYAGISLLGVLMFAAVSAGTRLLGSDPALGLVTYSAFTLLIMLAIGSALLLGERLPSRTLAGVRGLLYPVLAAVILLIVVQTNVNVVRADMYYRQAWVAYRVRGQPDLALALGRRALEFATEQDFYHFFLGDVLIEKAKRSARPEERAQFFGQAEQALLHARDLNPLKLDHTAGLARLHQIWAQYFTTPAERTNHLQRALVFYQQAAALSPHYPPIWNEWGTTYLLMGNTAEALEKYTHSLTLDDTFDQTYFHLGALYTTQGKWQEAVRAYEAAVARNPASIQGHRDLAVVYGMMGQLAEAERQFQRVLELAPDDLVSHKTLAQLYRATGQFDQALIHAQRALALAPPNERTSIEDLITQLRQQQRSELH
jgi:tetratricopeptide (TPR) repeat protein/O-antigen ligase